MLHTAYLLLGSNMGDRMEMLRQATERIEHQIGKIIISSSIYESSPWGFKDEINFFNQVHCIETRLSPYELLAGLLSIETGIGRTRHGNYYSRRLIDIDILFYDDIIIEHDNLTIPHPRLHERNFTLLPLTEIAADLTHPVFQLSVRELLLKCKDESQVQLFIPETIEHKMM